MSNPPPPRSLPLTPALPRGLIRLRPMLHFTIYALASFAAIATLLGFLGTVWWGFDLLDHPRPQYCLLLLPAIALTLLQRQFGSSLLWSLPLFVNLFLFLPLFLAPASPAIALSSPAAAPTESLRVLHVNLDRDNTNFYSAIRYIDDQEADLVFVQELTPDWLNHLQTDLKNYQLFIAEPRDNSQGSALFLPIAATKNIKVLNTQIINLPTNSDRPLLETTIFWAGNETVLLSFHATRPRNAGTSAFQQRELNAVAQWGQQQQQQNRDVILIGDFNSTPWSARFRSLLDRSQLLNSQIGFGLQPSWHAAFPAPVMIAIDHCLHSPSLKTRYRGTGEAIGSDHLPLYVELTKL